MSLASPYKGLDAFGDSDLDALLFFGREREREIVVANLIAARLTVLYGPTGVGKSSLLRAGVARALRELPESPVVVVFDRWSDDPSTDLAGAVAEAAAEEVGEGLLDVVERAQDDRDLYLILDQAEEYFVYQDEGSLFDAELARLVGDPVRVNVLLSLREDSLARLDRFKPRIPAVYANSLRLDRLDRDAGRIAITRPVERWNELERERVEIEATLVDAVLDGVLAGEIEHGGGQGFEGNGRVPTIEAPYLQLVMQRVWEVERAEESQVLRASTLARLGGARRVVADHLERAVAELTPAERDVAARLFTYLVTPSGTKIAQALPDLAEYAGVGEAEAAPVIEILSRHRILRPDEAGRTEIFHDVLASEVLGWRRAHEAVRALERERAESRRRHRRLAWLSGVALTALVLTALLAIFGFSQRSEARDEARKSKAHELEANAAAVLDRDPELSLLLAVEAARRAPSASSETMLRKALLASRVRAVVDIGKPVRGATAHGRTIVIATNDGHVVVADRRTGHREATITTGAPAVRVAFAQDGTVVLIGRDHRVRLVRPDGRVRAVPGVTDARAAAVSPDASLLAIIDPDGVRGIDVASGRERWSFARRGLISAAISNDDSSLVTGGLDESVLLWDLRRRRLARVLPHNEKHAVAVAFSPSGRLVAAGSTDNLARIWQATGDLVGVASTHTNAITDVAFSLDSDLIVTASRDGTARVEKADGGALLVTLLGHSDAVVAAEFAGGDGSSVVTSSSDGTVRLWNATFQPLLRELAQVHRRVAEVTFAGRRIRALTVDGRTHLLDAGTGAELRVGPGRRRNLRAVAPEGTTATIHGKNVILQANGRMRVLRGHGDRVLSVAFSADGSLLVTASKDHDARIWDVATAESLYRLPHSSKVRDAEFSPNGRWVVTASGRAAIWDTRDGALITRLQGHDGPVASAVFDPEGKTIVTGGDDGTVRTYRCDICGGLDQLITLAEARLAITGRELTPRERAKYLG